MLDSLGLRIPNSVRMYIYTVNVTNQQCRRLVDPSDRFTQD